MQLIPLQSSPHYLHAKALFDAKEYKRASWILERFLASYQSTRSHQRDSTGPSIGSIGSSAGNLIPNVTRSFVGDHSVDAMDNMMEDKDFAQDPAFSDHMIDSMKFLCYYSLYLSGEKQKRDHPDVRENEEIRKIVNALELECESFQNRAFNQSSTQSGQFTSHNAHTTYNALTPQSILATHTPQILTPRQPSQYLKQDQFIVDRKFDEYTSSQALSGPLWYLLGICHRNMSKKDLALECFFKSVQREPMLWCSWIAISELCDSKELFSQFLQKIDKAPEFRAQHAQVMLLFFKSHLHLELQMNEEAQEELDMLTHLFPNSSYIQAQRAFVVYNLTELEEAQKGLEIVLEKDPYRLEHMDTYSNILYVRNNKAKLSHLAHHAHKTEKYRAETCCIVGNYYSLKGMHEKAVIYFKRALRVNPKYLSAWTLMGHEYVEMKNTTAAVHAYRTAIDVNNRDYRAWYGLGQTYEILRMQEYALYYYSKATALRQYDGRMWCALASCYEQLERYKDSLRCYERAHLNHDPEGIALCKMANLYRRLNENRYAAHYFSKLLDQFGILREVEQFSRDHLPPSVPPEKPTTPIHRSGLSNQVFHLLSSTQDEFDTLEQDESMQGITSSALLFLSIFYLQERSDIETAKKFARYLHHQPNITDQIKKITQNILQIIMDTAS